jgi:hypothetical protein
VISALVVAVVVLPPCVALTVSTERWLRECRARTAWVLHAAPADSGSSVASPSVTE